MTKKRNTRYTRVLATCSQCDHQFFTRLNIAICGKCQFAFVIERDNNNNNTEE